ncbi:MAG: alpha-L-fucosidase [Clostridia bacterium]|nr:alpha-L-fucosidase [Clostridia bacterium]
MTNKEWFRQAGFGMMVHFGLYSVLGGEWRGKRMGQYDIGEWIQAQFRIPNSEYHRLADVFDPIYFDAEEWVLLAKEAGMKYMVVTSKHHEGFCLFDSEYDSFNCVKGSPFGRDIIAELAEACYKHGLKLGLYYSQALDWSHPDGGGYGVARPHPSAGTWCNCWDFPNNSEKDYTRLFETKIKTQMKEILTKYGELCLVWCDTPLDMTVEQSREIYDMIKRYQPNCLVNSRIGNGLGDYRSWGDNQIPDEYMKDGLFETPATLNDTWGYKSYDCHWKSAEKVIELKDHLSERGINYLLNVGPDHLGRIPAPAADILREVGKSLQK